MHVDVEAAGRALGQNLVVERAGLRAHIAGLDLREVLAEAFHDAGGAGLVLVAIEHELAFLLGLGDVGIGHEVEHLGRRLRDALRQHTGCRNPEKWQCGHCGPGFQQPAPRQLPIYELGHCYSPLVFCFLPFIAATFPLSRNAFRYMPKSHRDFRLSRLKTDPTLRQEAREGQPFLQHRSENHHRTAGTGIPGVRAGNFIARIEIIAG